MDERDLLKRLTGGQVHNVRFEEFSSLIEALGFRLNRVRGSHRIYKHRRAPAVLNVQPRRGHAKPYQIKQLLFMIEKHKLDLV